MAQLGIKKGEVMNSTESLEAKFPDTLKARVDALSAAARGKTVYLLVSGGSISTLMLHAWKSFAPADTTFGAIYLQFDDFIWLERENARQTAQSLGIELHEVPISERALLAEVGRDKFSRETLWPSVLGHASMKPFETVISSFGWPRLLCERDGHGTVILSERLPVPINAPKNFIDFFSNANSAEWRAFRSDPFVELFDTLKDEIPFPDVRYWQDFVFKKYFPQFQPCSAWKVEDYLGNLR